MRRLDCDNVRDDLPSLLAGALSPAAAQELEAHAAGCDDCRAELELLRALRRHAVEVPAGLEWRVRSAMRGPRRIRPWTIAGPATLAASIAAVLLVGPLRPGGIGGPPGDMAGDLLTPAAYEADLLEPFSGWPAVDGMLTGGVALDGLSTEELELLIAELDS